MPTPSGKQFSSDYKGLGFYIIFPTPPSKLQASYGLDSWANPTPCSGYLSFYIEDTRHNAKYPTTGVGYLAGPPKFGKLIAQNPRKRPKRKLFGILCWASGRYGHFEKSSNASLGAKASVTGVSGGSSCGPRYSGLQGPCRYMV